jgi:hypothetical protein
MSEHRVEKSVESRGDLVDEQVIQQFVGRVEPGDEVGLPLVLWTIGISLALLVGATIWWVSTH